MRVGCGYLFRCAAGLIYEAYARFDGDRFVFRIGRTYLLNYIN